MVRLWKHVNGNNSLCTIPLVEEILEVTGESSRIAGNIYHSFGAGTAHLLDRFKPKPCSRGIDDEKVRRADNGKCIVCIADLTGEMSVSHFGSIEPAVLDRPGGNIEKEK